MARSGATSRQCGDRLDDDVGWLDIAVDNSLLVGVIEGSTRSWSRGRPSSRGKTFLSSPGSGRGLARQIFHHDKGQSLLIAEIVDGNDIGVAQLRHGLCLAGKTFIETWVVFEVGRQHFDRDRAVQIRMPRLIDFPHARRGRSIPDSCSRQHW